MFKILTLNTIALKGLETFNPQKYTLSPEEKSPHAILVRSADLHSALLSMPLEIIARAGVGVNNIPITQCTELGIPVLNTPGANANAVKELVITGMLLASRHICSAWDFTRKLQGNDHELEHQVENNKKLFSGIELPNKTLGVVGLGNVGVKVANAALTLGMKVIGFDNSITVQNAWNLSSSVQQAHSLAEVCSQADFITLHVPLLDSTQHLINEKCLRLMKSNVVLLNFAREGIVDHSALATALAENKIRHYVCDFPCASFQNNPKVIALPHLGASTKEAEENCAVMAAEQIQKYLEHGAIKNSVNFPNVFLPRNEGYRLTVANRNVPNIIAQITTVLSKQNINILDMINKSRDDIAYNILDVDTAVNETLLQAIRKINGVIRARKL
ncbi:MAG: 3-phosphoglycerate dehydrogenase [Coxiella sp. RIFCSPHIGHO2_12_FULL_42_15]|nr:MAG: 3-phosphoglycerate dehydrogenase [Coxiella sp. RIFCSPHIGHO2_12_FULL_42_15]